MFSLYQPSGLTEFAPAMNNRLGTCAEVPGCQLPAAHLVSTVHIKHLFKTCVFCLLPAAVGFLQQVPGQ
jgi:hypothetical protein